VEDITDPGLLLKITPPKLRKTLLLRDRLRRLGTADDDTTVILVEAPAGYGKTSLIAQWRLDWLQGGAAVSWLNLDDGDSPITLVSGIAFGLRRSLGRATFAVDAIEAVRRGAGTAPALTSLLAEITEASRPMVLVFDNGERLGEAEAMDVLEYLLHNLPPNLRVVIGTRPPVHAEVLDLLGQGLLRRVTAAELCFNLSEGIQFLTTRFGGRIDADLCARLHDVTGGWPLGLQLAAAALERSPDLRRMVDDFSKSRDDATRHLLESLVASLPNDLGGFLTRCSLLGALHPSLCEAVTGREDAALALQRLVFETPLVSATEEGEWLRLHPLARQYLRARAEQTLSPGERREIHVRAWHWLVEHGAPARAARYALAAGNEHDALELILVALNDELNKGHNGTVIEWLARMPAEAIESNVQVRLAALWIAAFGFQVEEAMQKATALIDDPSVDEAIRTEAIVALAAALAMVDRYDEAHRYAALCRTGAMSARARFSLAYLEAELAFQAGQIELARRLLVSIEDGSLSPVTKIWRDFKTAVSYLWEGRPALAEQAARPKHSEWEAEVGRRGQWAAMIGSVLAGACWQQDMRSEAKALLAGRIDVIERAVGYGGVFHAYRTLAQMAALEGDEARAFAYLEAMTAVGESRGMVRTVANGLVERVRLHAARKRPGQAAEVLAELATVVERSSKSDPLAPQIDLMLEMACTYVAVVTGADDAAGAHLNSARELATRLNRGYEAVQILALQALLEERNGRSPDAMLTEAISRAESGGLVRVFADTLPDVVDLVRRRTRQGHMGVVSHGFIDRLLAAAEAPPSGEQQAAPSGRSAMLTPKESQVLQLLAGGLQNKQIATELDLSADTVKWHVKKLLAKLNAGNRDHAVDRARMLGLLR
jgi:LuxR family transcriptional regulator, maltose regulon positive regulatory protein